MSTPRAQHRTPAGGERQRDAERTKSRLRESAFDEFSRHGFDGARVSTIAANAGVNKQLISYYFGSKEGLYRALKELWLAREDDFAHPDTPAEELGQRYLHDLLADPRGARLAIWRALSDDAPDTEPQSHIDLEQQRMRERQERGEISSDLDPAGMQLALMGMVMAPIILPDTVRKLFGVDPQDPEFEQRYGETIRHIVRSLREPSGGSPPDSSTTGPTNATPSAAVRPESAPLNPHH